MDKLIMELVALKRVDFFKMPRTSRGFESAPDMPSSCSQEARRQKAGGNGILSSLRHSIFVMDLPRLKSGRKMTKIAPSNGENRDRRDEYGQAGGIGTGMVYRDRRGKWGQEGRIAIGGVKRDRQGE